LSRSGDGPAQVCERLRPGGTPYGNESQVRGQPEGGRSFSRPPGGEPHAAVSSGCATGTTTVTLVLPCRIGSRDGETSSLSCVLRLLPRTNGVPTQCYWTGEPSASVVRANRPCVTMRTVASAPAAFQPGRARATDVLHAIRPPPKLVARAAGRSSLSEQKSALNVPKKTAPLGTRRAF
jgi:hypothetical protein